MPLTSALLALTLLSMHHARGTFTVDLKPLTSTLPGTSRYSLDKQFHGDIEGTSQGEMFGAGDPKKGAAGYVAIEVITATMGGKHGTFALQHSSTMDASGMKQNIQVAPGSGTGDFTGISGNFEIILEPGKHSYDFTYTLPD